MARLRVEPDDVTIDVAPGESALDAAIRSGLPIAHACGGRARCSTCRIRILTSAADLPAPTAQEGGLKDRLGLGPEIRLACQLRPEADLAIRRLVIDETDLALANQLHRARAPKPGEIRRVAVMFFDVADFTGISEKVPAYDVLYLLNRFLTRAERILAAHGGYFDKAVGDGFIAIFGVDDSEHAALRAAAAGLEVLAEVDRVRPFILSAYGVEFDARIGIAYGEALIGSLGPAGQEQLTVIGEVSNIASRVEAANKEAGTRLLVTEELFEAAGGGLVSPDFIRTALRGAAARFTLYEVSGLTPEGRARLDSLGDDGDHGAQDAGGRVWSRVARSEDLPEGGSIVVENDRVDVAVVRRDGAVFAFNNACPHLHYPLFGETIEAQGPLPFVAGESVVRNAEITCRFHESAFDLHTGEVRTWCRRLPPDGRIPGFEFLGDLSKNQSGLEILPCREADGAIWVSSGASD